MTGKADSPWPSPASKTTDPHPFPFPSPHVPPVVPGRFIVFEGIDGSGKSTALRRVAGALHESGRDVVTTREETETWRGEAVRRAIAEKANPWTTLHLFLADRAAHVPEIQGHLEDGQTVLCDRFLHSTLAYQSVTLADALHDPIAHLRDLHRPWCPDPDHVVLLDLDPEVAVGRAEDRGATTPYEKVEFLAQVRAAYLDLAEQDGFAVIDAAQSPERVAADALAAVDAVL